MQRKRHINFKYWRKTIAESSTSTDSHNSIQNKLHSIPKLLNMKQNASQNITDDNINENNVKSNVLYSIPCVKSCVHTFCSSKRISILTTLFVGFVSCLLLSGLSHGSCSAAASTSLTIDGGSSKSITGTIAPNETKYVSSNVTYSANDVQDYAIKISYANGSNGLKYDGSSDITINGVVDNTTGSNISNAWGYSWADGDTTESSYANLPYSSIPISGTKNVETGTTINSTTKKMIFAANLSDSNPTGHYKANVLLSLVATPTTTTYTITYDANGGSGAPASTTCVAQGAAGTNCAATLSSSAPTKSGHLFLGWADANTATTKQYDAGGSITVNSDKTIYAVWEDVRTMEHIANMQDISSNICANTVAGTTYTLKDLRDNSSYAVRKFADGRCWMTSNLKISNQTVSSLDSDVNSNFTIPVSSASGFTDNTAINTYVSTNTGYYSWCAATAKTCANVDTLGSNAESSICPRGWNLPSRAEFSAFMSAEGITNSSASSIKIRSAPYNFAYTGYMKNGSLTDTSSSGWWWSRTAYNSGNAYYLEVSDSGVLSSNVHGRYYGVAIRCIASTSGYDSAPE